MFLSFQHRRNVVTKFIEELIPSRSNCTQFSETLCPSTLKILRGFEAAQLEMFLSVQHRRNFVTKFIEDLIPSHSTCTQLSELLCPSTLVSFWYDDSSTPTANHCETLPHLMLRDSAEGFPLLLQLCFSFFSSQAPIWLSLFLALSWPLLISNPIPIGSPMRTTCTCLTEMPRPWLGPNATMVAALGRSCGILLVPMIPLLLVILSVRYPYVAYYRG